MVRKKSIVSFEISLPRKTQLRGMLGIWQMHHNSILYVRTYVPSKLRYRCPLKNGKSSMVLTQALRLVPLLLLLAQPSTSFTHLLLTLDSPSTYATNLFASCYAIEHPILV